MGGNKVQPSVIEADMAGVPDFESFKQNIGSCSAWSGNFGGRKRRAIGNALEDNEEVPSIMESGNGALTWVKTLVRRVRDGQSEINKSSKGKGKKNKNARKTKKGRNGKKGAKRKKGNKKGKGKKNKNARKT